jgi:hypothetical protein
MLAQLAAAHPDIIERGGDVIGVAPAAGYQATHLMETSIPFDLYMDRDHTLSERLDLGEQSLWEFIFNLGAWWNYLSALARHHRQGKITQSYTVLPAIMVVDEAGSTTYLHRGTGIADYPPLDEVLGALDEAIGI